MTRTKDSGRKPDRLVAGEKVSDRGEQQLQLEGWEKDLVEQITGVEQERIQLAGRCRDSVIRCGKLLRELQERQRQRRQKKHDSRTWEQYLEEKKGAQRLFPSRRQASYYIRIADYPQAYEEGMSIKEAHRAAKAWHDSGGKPPLQSKVSIQPRFLATLLKEIRTARKRLAKRNKTENWSEIAAQEKWSDDECDGAEESLMKFVEEANAALAKVRAMRQGVVDE